ncbi:MAG: hypothetical protein R3264_11650, partial [Anaerolineae bacterium]|nr:hypothetical protein [Anaerolineae bacterium]
MVLELAAGAAGVWLWEQFGKDFVSGLGGGAKGKVGQLSGGPPLERGGPGLPGSPVPRPRHHPGAGSCGAGAADR